MLAEILTWLYPDARPNVDWAVADSGRGAFIAAWNVPGVPQPREADLLAQADNYLLDRAKRQAIAAIDARSRALLTAGLEVYVGIKISTSEAAQRNLSDLYSAVRDGLVELPQGVSTLDDGEYIIEDWQHLLQIVGLWAARKKLVLDIGRSLRLLVKAAMSAEAVEAVWDHRE